MLNSLSWFVGLRYVRARSHKFFVSFITWVSLLCVCLGVTALIVVLSVMNGLEGDLRERLLALSAHARIFVTPGASPNPDWAALTERVRRVPEVTGVAPYIEIEALAVRKPEMLPIRLRGIEPDHEGDVARVAKAVIEGSIADLTPGSEHVIIGRTLAQMLGVGLGDPILVLVPVTDANGAPEPRLREYRVAGVFEADQPEYDGALMLAALADVRALLPDPDARMSLHVNYVEAIGAPGYTTTLARQLPAGVQIRDWTVDHASYFRAIRIEKTMIAIILMLIVAVAAFYLVAMLAMVVTDKRTDIAILRTLGTSPRRVMAVFLIQGGVIAWFGVALGIVFGCLIGYYAGDVAAFLEWLFRFQFFNSDVYVVTKLPSELRFGQVAWIAGVAMLIALAGTIYPAFRASRVPPADALRYEWLIGIRYLRSRHRSGFVSFVASMSVIGLALGVAVLVVVLSVLNGFEKELRSRMLSVTSHGTISGLEGEIADWRGAQAQLAKWPGVRAVAPYIEARGLLAHGQAVAGTVVRGVSPAAEGATIGLGSRMLQGDLADLEPGKFRVILGSALAAELGVKPGQTVVLMTPEATATPAGLMPRMRRFNVSGIFESGMYEYDRGLALMHLEDAARLYRLGDRVTGLRLALDDPFAAPRLVRSAAETLDISSNQNGFYVSDWTRDHANFFRSIELTKSMMFFILLILVVVAAINLIATLVMIVKEKQTDIAILRTIGAAPGNVLLMFVVQGGLIGLVGTLAGAALGWLLALNVTHVVHGIERLFGVRFLDPSVYLMSDLPSEVHASDVLQVASVALLLAALATIYPAWRASRTLPAEALRHE